MNFADVAIQLCGQCALLLGWRPNDFWSATPAELGCVLAAFATQRDEPPDVEKLMELFPDG